MNRADIFEFFRRLAEANPSPETELEFGNTYQLLALSTGVAVSWSQHHGGPYPASSSALHTSVGATAIRQCSSW